LLLNASPVYINQQGEIKVQGLYTGVNKTNISFNIISPSGVTVSSAYANYNASPNQELSHSFFIGPITQVGTTVFDLRVSFNGVTQDYPISVIAIPSSAQLQPSLQTAVSINLELPTIALIAIALFLIPPTVVVVSKRLSERFTKKSSMAVRAPKLKMIKRRLQEEEE
jgi:hypothetical protein